MSRGEGTSSAHKSSKTVSTNEAVQKPNPTMAGEKPQQIWKELLKQLSSTEPATYAILLQGKLVSCEMNTYCWMPSGGNVDYFIGILSAEPRRNAIVAALNALTGEECKFRAIDSKGSTANSHENEDDFLKELQSSFGASNVVVQDTAN